MIFQVKNYSYQILSPICIHICMSKNFVCIVSPLPIFLACFTRDMGHASQDKIAAICISLKLQHFSHESFIAIKSYYHGINLKCS